METIYLAGPISGCNDDQRFGWRRDLKGAFAKEFTFIDPTDNLIGANQSHYKLVQADIEAIRRADAVIANMWRESVGTALGVLHAHDASKPVVICDPNFINSRMLAFYADSVVRDTTAAIEAVRTILNSQKAIEGVRKQSGKIERFDRVKFSKSLRKACLDAGQSDILPPRVITAQALALILAAVAKSDGFISTAMIKELTWEAMAEIAAEPQNVADYDKIRQSWDSGKPLKVIGDSIGIHAKPLEVKVRTHGTHSTIWGPLHKITSSARDIVNAICCVEGITEVVFGPFTNTHSPTPPPPFPFVGYKNRKLIEG